jgi:hypothetical protein
MPGHSCLHSLAAKLASMMLKPLIESQPHIIHGTKDFIKKIEQAWFKSSDKVFIVGGDIKAYYPSVPTPEAVRITKEMMEVEPHLETQAFKSGFFEGCLDVANSTIVMRFQEDWYALTDRVAMGMAHSPDLANIYSAYFENRIVPNIPGILYYGRYIDDVIFIIIAESEEDAEAKAKALEIGTCRIAWESARTYWVFLDVRLWIENGVIHHRPHRKIGNHLERIPWTSAHPQDVKRGTYLGKLSRMATLCSTVILYNESCAELRELYIKRGYPINLVEYWHNHYASKFWDHRLTEREAAPEVQVMRTRFNPVWEHVNIHAVESAVKDQWEKDRNFGRVIFPASMELPLVLSRGCTFNTGDLMTRLCKSVLDYSSHIDDEWIRELNPWIDFDAWKKTQPNVGWAVTSCLSNT